MTTNRALRKIRKGRGGADGLKYHLPASSDTCDHRDPKPEAWAAFESSGWRWSGLGLVLLGVMITGIWEANHNPVAISAVLVAIPAILHEVPKIINARTNMLAKYHQDGDNAKR